MKIHHIGYLVKKIDRAFKEFETLGFSYEDLSGSGTQDMELKSSLTEDGANIPYTIDNIRKVKIVFMKNEFYRIELVEPLNKDSSIYGLMKKYKNSPYHICYSTDNIEQAISNLEHRGWVLFEPPEIAPAINNCKVAFLMGTNSGMLELVENIKSDN